MSPLVKRLLEKGLITRDVLPGLDSLRADMGGTTLLNILRAGLVEEDRMLDFICENFDVPTVLQFEMEDIEDPVIAAVPQRVVEVHRAVPIALTDEAIEVVMSDPTDLNALGALKAATGREVQPRIAAESVISWALLRYYEIITPSIDEALGREKVTRPVPASELEAYAEQIQEEPVQLTVVVDDVQPEGQPASAEPLIEVEEGQMEIRPERISFPVIETTEEIHSGPEMGNWDAPFELERAVSSTPPAPSPERTLDLPGPKVPEKIDPGEEDAGDDDEGTLLLVDEEDWADAGAALEDEIESDAVTGDEAIIVDDRQPTAPITVMRNVVLGQQRDSEIIPPQPMTRRRAVEEIVGPGPAKKKDVTLDLAPAPPAAREVKKGAFAPLGTLKPAPSSRGAAAMPAAPAPPQAPPSKQGRIVPDVHRRWKEALEGASTRDEALKATLEFLDATFGPALFLARKGDGLAGWIATRAFIEMTGADVRQIAISPPAPREVWHAMERKRGMLGPISVLAEYPFLPAGEAKPSILVLPVVIRNIAAGAFLCVLRDAWAASPDLRDALESLGIVLSEKLEEILKNRKKSQG